MARPTKYTEENIAKAKDYLEVWESTGDVIPSQSGLADFLNISIACVENWATHEEKQEFLGVLDAIERKQRNILINRGLKGEFNSNIAKLVLGKHGFKEKTENALTGYDGGPIESKWTVTIVDPKDKDA